LLYRNGILQKQGLDYSLTNQNITFIPQAIPQPGDVLLASYRTAGSGGTLPQVLCTTQGNANGTNTVVSLGSCTIPANLLRAGDRVELMFDFSHQGVLSPFTYQVKWGATQLTSRTVSATANLASGRSSVSIFAGAAQASTLAWGSGGLALQGDAVTATDSIINTITIDFQAGLATPSTDTVTLRNYSVVRYPAP
jgi:hypothetical protein